MTKYGKTKGHHCWWLTKDGRSLAPFDEEEDVDQIINMEAARVVDGLVKRLEQYTSVVEKLQAQYMHLTGRRFILPLRIGPCSCDSGHVLIIAVTETVANVVDGEPCVAVKRGESIENYYCPRCGAPVEGGGC